MPNSPQSALKRAEKMISQWSKAPSQMRKSTGKTVRRVENSVTALAAALSGAVPAPRVKKGGAKKMTRRMSSSRSKRMTRRK